MRGEAKSRSNINIPGVQEELLAALLATGKPVVVLINAGTATLALAVDEVLEIETPDASANTPEPAAGQSFCFCSRHIQLDPARSAALIEPAALLGALAAPG